MPAPASSSNDEEDELYRYYFCRGGGPVDGDRLRFKLGTTASPEHVVRIVQIHVYVLTEPGGGASPYYQYKGVRK